MKLCIEARYSSEDYGPEHEIVWVDNQESLATTVQEICAKAGFSDLIMVDVDRLPESTREAWEQRRTNGG